MPRIGSTSPQKKGEKTIDEKLALAIASIKDSGFRSPNEFILAFYNSQHASQSLKVQEGKAYSPGRIMDAWFDNATPDARKALQDEVMWRAATIFKTEMQRASNHSELCIPSEDQKKLNLAYLKSDSFGLTHIHGIYKRLLPYTVTLFVDLLTHPNNYERWHHREKVDKELNAERLVVVLISELLFFRSQGTNAFQVIMGLFLASSGTSRRVIENLHSMSLSMGYTTIQSTLSNLTSRAEEAARAAARSDRVYAVVFDNINFTLRKASQRLDSNTQQLNATTLALFLLPKSFNLTKYAKALSLSERRKYASQQGRLQFSDIVPRVDTIKHVEMAFKHAIREILIEYHPNQAAFSKKALQRLRQHVRSTQPNVRRLESDKTEFFPLAALNEEEASVPGTIKVVEKIYMEKLGLTQEEACREARLLVGDWLSVRNLRLLLDERADETRTFERFEWINEASMPFHFQLNAMYSLCRTHFGNPTLYHDPACLEHHRTILRRSKLDAKKPEYNRAKELVAHSLIARIFDCARVVLGKKDVDDLKTWLPEIEDLDRVADAIYTRFACTAAAHDALALDDEYRAHSILFIRDALFFRVFQDAIRYADVGMMWVVYDHWIFMMRGAGCNNYGNELLKMKSQYLYELPPLLREVVERTWLVNRWGQEGRSIPTDLYLEHNNGFTKNMFAAMGSGASIKHVQEKSSANVEILRSLAHNVSEWFGATDYHRGHKEVKAQADLRAIMVDLKKHKVHEVQANRIIPIPESNKRKKAKNDGQRERAIKDVLLEGRTKLTEGGLFEEWHIRKGEEGDTEDRDEEGDGDDEEADGGEPEVEMMVEGFVDPDGQLDHDLSLDSEFTDNPFGGQDD